MSVESTRISRDNELAATDFTRERACGRARPGRSAAPRYSCNV